VGEEEEEEEADWCLLGPHSPRGEHIDCSKHLSMDRRSLNTLTELKMHSD
jgi:hypothetical protein